MSRIIVRAASIVAIVIGAMSTPVVAGGDEHTDKARAMIDKAAAYLRSRQDAATGGWSVPAPDTKKPALPAVTALVMTGLLGVSAAPGKDASASGDAAIDAGTRYLLKFAKPDGGIYDNTLPSYNTAIALSTLSRIDKPEARAAIKPAQDFLRKLQWSEDTSPAVGGPEAGKPVDKNHPFYGGIGYGSGGRPDLSNLGFMLQAFHDSGVAADDVAYKRAIVFLQRCQMNGTINDQDYAKGSKQGGFIYSTSENKDKVGSGESKAKVIEETMDDGTKVSRLRAYGSMTYLGFKSYLYADLARDDKRVTEALRWIRANYTLEENPGMGPSGMYYYYVTFARALEAWGETNLDVSLSHVPKEQGLAAVKYITDWKHDLIDRLATLQNEDGSFKSVDERWMENDPVLITAYALIALEEAAREK